MTTFANPEQSLGHNEPAIENITDAQLEALVKFDATAHVDTDYETTESAIRRIREAACAPWAAAIATGAIVEDDAWCDKVGAFAPKPVAVEPPTDFVPTPRTEAKKLSPADRYFAQLLLGPTDSIYR